MRSGSVQGYPVTVADRTSGTKGEFEKFPGYDARVAVTRQGTTGAILAGGRSERLGGRSKALLPIGRGGAPLVVATADVLREICDPVLVRAREAGDFASLGLSSVRLVPDAVRGRGPLAGLAAVLEASPHERCLVVACDMPSLSRPLLEALIALSHEHAGATAVVPRTERGLHPLHAVYRRTLLPEIRRRLEGGWLALHDLLAATGTLEVAEADLRRYDPGLVSLENVNTPEDLARAVGAERAKELLA